MGIELVLSFLRFWGVPCQVRKLQGLCSSGIQFSFLVLVFFSFLHILCQL